MCAKKGPGESHGFGIIFTWNSQDLRQEVVGHIEATLNASAREVGEIEIYFNHEVGEETLGGWIIPGGVT